MDDPEVRRVGLDDLGTIAAADPESDEAQRIFTDAYEFVEQQDEPPVPLWGDEKTSLVPEGGLAIVAGRPGVGKTSLVVDLACHLAAGVAYPPRSEVANGNCPDAWPVPRPLRVALIENEGPVEMFRQKLKKKLATFPHEIRDGDGSLLIQTWRWGSFSFRDDYHEKLATELDWEGVDIVIGDPLNMLGIEGVGSPAETREFVQLLGPLGLRQKRAFIFLHHFRERVERNEDELARISGAWGGHLDTLITVGAGHLADHARLAFPKIRWGTEQPPPALVLGRVWNTASFELLGKEDEASLLDPVIAAHLEETRNAGAGRSGKGWLSATELAKAIESRRGAVQKALEGNDGLFCSLTGQDAKDLGARRNTTLWGLRTWLHSRPNGDIPFG